jgi:hypothetical protein
MDVLIVKFKNQDAGRGEKGRGGRRRPDQIMSNNDNENEDKEDRGSARGPS